MTDRELAGCPVEADLQELQELIAHNRSMPSPIITPGCEAYVLHWLRNRRTPSSEGDGRDAERLDWVQSVFEKSHSSISFRHYARGCMGCEIFTVPSQHVRGYGVRGAIDAAIAAAARSQGTDQPE